MTTSAKLRIVDDPLETLIGDYPPSIKKALRYMRDLIAETAGETKGVGEIRGATKWGQASYEAVRPKTGSPMRLDRVRGSNTRCALYFICTTNLVEQMRQHYGDILTFEGNRAIVLDSRERLPEAALKHCIALALTYRLRKNS